MALDADHWQHPYRRGHRYPVVRSYCFYGHVPGYVLLEMIISNYIFKCSVETLVTPFTYQVINFLKKAEHEDYYDYGTDFNPFKIEDSLL